MRRVVLLVALSAGTAGCATVMRGTSEQVAFDTVPSGAEVRVLAVYAHAGGETNAQPPTMGCVTPCVLQVKRADKLAVTVTKTGYETESFSIAPQVGGEGIGAGIVGNAIIGGVLGAGIDALSGATLDHCPNPVRIVLRPVPMPASAQPPTARRRGVTIAATVAAAPPEPAFGYDAAAACKEQLAAKYQAVPTADARDMSP